MISFNIHSCISFQEYKQRNQGRPGFFMPRQVCIVVQFHNLAVSMVFFTHSGRPPFFLGRKPNCNFPIVPAMGFLYGRNRGNPKAATFLRPRKGGIVSLAPISDKTLIKCFEDKTSVKNVLRYHTWLKSEERNNYGRIRRRF